MVDERKPVSMLPLARVIAPMQERIRELAADSENIAISSHALERMDERDITDMEVFRVLRQGSIEGSPWIEPKNQEQACKVVLRPRGARSMGVVSIILARGKLLVKTVEWEDER